jgi:hypothetical protein
MLFKLGLIVLLIPSHQLEQDYIHHDKLFVFVDQFFFHYFVVIDFLILHLFQRINQKHLILNSN